MRSGKRLAIDKLEDDYPLPGDVLDPADRADVWVVQRR
jgi:hypothetical protein